MLRRYNTRAVYFDRDGHELTNKRDRIIARTGGHPEHYNANYQAITTGEAYHELRSHGIPTTFGDVSHLVSMNRANDLPSRFEIENRQYDYRQAQPGARISNRPQRGPYNGLAHHRGAPEPVNVIRNLENEENIRRRIEIIQNQTEAERERYRPTEEAIRRAHEENIRRRKESIRTRTEEERKRRLG